MFETEKVIDFVGRIVNPVAHFLHFLISTPLGYSILAVFLIYFLSTEIDRGIFKRKMYKSGGHTSFARLSVFEGFFFGFQAFLKAVARIAYKLAILVSIYLFLSMIVKLDKTLSESNESLKQQRRNQDLASVMKQISKQVNIAEIKVDNVDYANFPDIRTSLKIKYYDLSRQAFRDDVQQIDILGADIYIDVRQLNFDYSSISSPEKAIKFPTKLYSEIVPQEKAIKLQYLDSIGVPFYLKKKETDIYGLTKDAYFSRIKELLSWTVPSPETKLLGIRSFNLQALHKKVTKSEIITIQLDQNGEIIMNSNWNAGLVKDKAKKKVN